MEIEFLFSQRRLFNSLNFMKARPNMTMATLRFERDITGINL